MLQFEAYNAVRTDSHVENEKMDHIIRISGSNDQKFSIMRRNCRSDVGRNPDSICCSPKSAALPICNKKIFSFLKFGTPGFSE